MHHRLLHKCLRLDLRIISLIPNPNGSPHRIGDTLTPTTDAKDPDILAPTMDTKNHTMDRSTDPVTQVMADSARVIDVGVVISVT